MNAVLKDCLCDRLTEETYSLAPPNNPAADRWASRDVTALSGRLATSPIFLDLEASEAVLQAANNGGPVPGQTRISLRQSYHI
jgi:cytochrome oxidase assembly protein ShyY1